MIRKLQKADLNDVANLWLDTNLKAHNFISAEYWNTNFEFVKEMLPQAEVYVYENDKKIFFTIFRIHPGMFYCWMSANRCFSGTKTV